MDRLDGKTCVLTGATSGVGLEAASRLAQLGARLILVGRDPGKAAATRQLVGPDAELLIGDLADVADLRRLAGEILERAPRLDILVNNAGAIFTRRLETGDGLERTFALNHMAYFRLTTLLLDRLRQSAPSRIVVVASEAHRGAQLDFDDLQTRHDYSGRRVYQRSKLANILFTRALARRLEGSGVTANALHPGFVASRFGDETHGLFRVGFRLAKLFAITPQQAAETVLHLAATAEGGTSNGGYFVKCRPSTPTAAAQDAASAERLWAESERLSKL